MPGLRSRTGTLTKVFRQQARRRFMSTPADEDIRIWGLWQQGMKPSTIAEILKKPVEFIYKRLKHCQRQLISA
jgi:hypothetical protein